MKTFGMISQNTSKAWATSSQTSQKANTQQVPLHVPGHQAQEAEARNGTTIRASETPAQGPICRIM